MRFRVCRVDKLTGYKAVRYLFSKLICLCDSTLHSLCALGEHKLCAVCFHKLSALNRHRLGHYDYRAVASCRRDGGKSYTRVARGRLDYNRAGLQLARLLGVIKHRLCHSVLYRPCRIEVFELCEHRRTERLLLFYSLKLKQRCCAYKLICGFIYTCHFLFPLMR